MTCFSIVLITVAVTSPKNDAKDALWPFRTTDNGHQNVWGSDAFTHLSKLLTNLFNYFLQPVTNCKAEQVRQSSTMTPADRDLDLHIKTFRLPSRWCRVFLFRHERCRARYNRGFSTWSGSLRKLFEHGRRHSHHGVDVNVDVHSLICNDGGLMPFASTSRQAFCVRQG